MADQIEHAQQAGKEQFESMFSSSSHISDSFQQVMRETIDYSRRSVESTTAFFERMMGVRSPDKAIQLQMEFAKTQTEDFIAQMTKIADIYKGMAGQAYQPVESAVEKGKEMVQH